MKTIFKILGSLILLSAIFGEVTEIRLLQDILNMMFIGIVVLSEE
jgi:hypothetical protein|uniref:Uncharacterized protein n=1 Tax=Myoviridae sp. ctqfO1 TaxID=2827710 RepID=A0A8S5T295_9CAUD|nr:MAG TPA: hypothetical protein [Myoviridae sp. ctqfO1]